MSSDERAADWDGTDEDEEIIDSIWEEYRKSGLPGEANVDRLEESQEAAEEIKKHGGFQQM